MNDRVSDAKKEDLTQEEALQVLRLSPEGLRRLADLDEAITELKSTRRSLIVNRLESISEAMAAARKGRDGNGTVRTSVADGPQGAAREAAVVEPDGVARGAGVVEPNGAARDASVVEPNGDRPERSGVAANGRTGGSPAASADSPPQRHTGAGQAEVAALQNELRMMRSEIADLRRQIAALGGPVDRGDELQQIIRRLTYLEAELESRHL